MLGWHRWRDRQHALHAPMGLPILLVHPEIAPSAATLPEGKEDGVLQAG